MAALERRLGELQGELAEVGFFISGSVVRRFMPCGTPGCRCQGDPPQLHGPYWQWSTRVGGKTMTRRLNPSQAAVYEQLVANRRRLRGIVAEMEKVSERAAEILIEDTAEALAASASNQLRSGRAR